MQTHTTIATRLSAPPFQITAAALKALPLDAPALKATLRTFAGNCRKELNQPFGPVKGFSWDLLRDCYADAPTLAAMLETSLDRATAIAQEVASRPYTPRLDAETTPAPRPMPGPLGSASREPAPAITAPQPAPVAAPVTGSDPAMDLVRAIERIAGQTGRPLDEARVIELIQQHAPTPAPRGLAITINQAPAVHIDTAHVMLPAVLTWIASGAFPALIGPAGTGKTELVMQAAKALGRDFTMSGAVESQYKLSGFMDAHGRYVRTPFRDAYENGKAFLLDDTDRSSPGALNWLNAALANGCCDFPDGMVRRHPDFVCALSANTYGRGSDRQYVGANQLDAATLDRFQFIEVDYDEDLERRLTNNDAWCDRVQALRAAARRVNARVVISMRASIRGAAALAAGIPQAAVEDATIWKGLDAATRAKITEGAR